MPGAPRPLITGIVAVRPLGNVMCAVSIHSGAPLGLRFW